MVSVPLTEAATVLAQDVPHLVRESVALAKAEAKVAAKSVGLRAGLVAAFALCAGLGVFFAALAASIGISQLTETPWAGPLVTGSFLIVVALIGVPLSLKTGAGPEAA